MSRLWIIVVLLSGTFIVSGWWWGWDIDAVYSLINESNPYSSQSLEKIVRKGTSSLGLDTGLSFLNEDDDRGEYSDSQERPSDDEESISDSIKETLSETTHSAYSVVEKTGNNIVDSAQSYLKDVLSSVKKNITDVSGISFVLDGDASSHLDYGFSIAVKVNTPVMFVVKNTGEEDASYSIDWSDGDISAGMVSKRSEKIVQHVWNTVGDHVIEYNGVKTTVRVVQ